MVNKAINGASKSKERPKQDLLEKQIVKVAEIPVIVTWSDNSTSESTLKSMFKDEESYKHYEECKKNGNRYPVKVEAIEPLEADKEKRSNIFFTGTLTDDYEVAKMLCKGFNESLQRYLGI